MKTLHILFTLFVFSCSLISCKNEEKQEATPSPESKTQEVSEIVTENMAITNSEFTIEGMTCAMGCAKRIENKLAEIEGVSFAQVDFDKKLAMVTYQEGKVTSDLLVETVKSAGEGYSVKEMTTVKSFSSNEAKDHTAHVCSEKCHKEGCTAAMKAACKKDCKMPCCSKKA